MYIIYFLFQYRLRGWFNTLGHIEETKSLSRTFETMIETGSWVTLAEAKENNLGEKGVSVYTVKATISMLRSESALYKACPSENCKKKVIIVWYFINIIKRS